MLVRSQRVVRIWESQEYKTSRDRCEQLGQLCVPFLNRAINKKENIRQKETNQSKFLFFSIVAIVRRERREKKITVVTKNRKNNKRGVLIMYSQRWRLNHFQ
jgi:hypothetical protein